MLSEFWKRPMLVAYSFIMFLCVINANILLDLKEALLVPRFGAEVIPFIKLWFVMPSYLIFFICFSALANRISHKKLFGVTVLPFLLWMLVFSFYIYPDLELFKLGRVHDVIKSLLPESLWLISALIEYWPLTVTYICGELWANGVLCTLFWSEVNYNSTIKSSFHDYPVLTLISNSSTILCGAIIYLVVSYFYGEGQLGWQKSLVSFAVIFTACGLGMIITNSRIAEAGNNNNPTKTEQKKSETVTSLPLKESIVYLIKSPDLRYIALIMLGYCIAINTAEVAWKSQLVRIYPNAIEYSIFSGKLRFFTGLCAVFMALAATKAIHYGWRKVALATPLLLAATGLSFFLIMLLSGSAALSAALTSKIVVMGVATGALCNVVGKSAKYSLFDASKEMAFVPLDNEQRVKGKASIELLVGRAGKSSSALIQQCLIITYGSLSAAMHWLAGIFLVVIVLWIHSVNALARRYEFYQSREESQQIKQTSSTS